MDSAPHGNWTWLSLPWLALSYCPCVHIGLHMDPGFSAFRQSSFSKIINRLGVRGQDLAFF